MERKGDPQTLQTKLRLNVCSGAACGSSRGLGPAPSRSSCLRVIRGREASRLSPEETTDDTAERGGGEGEEEEEEEDEEEKDEEEDEEEESVGGPGDAADMRGPVGGTGEGEGDTVGDRTGSGDCVVALESGEGHG